MATTILQLYGNSARQIRPAVINTFQNNGNVDRLEFQMEDYNQDNVDLSTMGAYAIVYGSLGLDEIKLESEVTSDGVLKIYWDLNSYTLALGEKIFYQICFKSEGSQVWTSYKGVIFCNESLTADEEIVAQYPTILKQMEGRIETRTDEAIDEFTVIASEQLNNTVERVNELADNFDASVVYVPYGETIPIEDRLNNRLYYIYTDEEHSSGRFEDSEGTTLFLDMSGCGNLFIGQTVFSLLPIKNSCVHLLDGSKLYGEGTYSGFVEYALRLYKNKPSSNVNLVGDLNDVDCVLSGFSSTNYATLPNVFSPESKPWEIVVSGTFVKNEEMQSFVTPQADDDSGVYIGTDSEGCFYVELTSDTDDYIGCINSDTYLKEGEQYWIKASFTGTEYRLEYSSDGIDYNLEGFSIQSTNPVRQGVGLALGIEYYRGKLEHAGEIYLNECYINVDGKRWWTGAMPSYFTDEATWQKSVNDFGVCGKFVYDSDENSIRLPKVTGFVEGTVDPKALGDFVAAGLPNITGKFESKGINSEFGTINYGEGAFTVNVGGGLDETGNAGTSNIVNTDVAQFDASKSNEIYGNSNTVQPQAIKGYYHIVVATGLVDEIEINPYLEQLEDKTEECIERLVNYGNGFNLFDTKLSDHYLENPEGLGWELQGTYVSEAIYPDFCFRCFEEKRLGEAKEITIAGSTITIYENINGHKFYDIADKGVIDTLYESTGTAWYYGLDEENRRVFLPRDDYFAVKGIAPVAGNGMALGLTDGTVEASMHQVKSSSYTYLQGRGAIGQDVGDTQSTGDYLGNNLAIGITTDSTKSGIETHLAPQENKYLYICVGNTVVNQSLVDVAQLSGELKYKAEKTDVDGQWVGKTAVLTQSVTKGVTEIDMSEYLPQDDYQYEVLLICGHYYKSDACFFSIYSDVVSQPSHITLTLGSEVKAQSTYIYIPIGTERKLYQYLSAATRSGTNGEYGIEALGYRRVGKNT